MKKALCLLLVLLMSANLFAGCREETPQESTGTTELPTQSTEEAANRVVNGVYATCGNYKYTIRTKENARIKFYLVTEKPLPKDAAITVDTESEYMFWLRNKTPERAYAEYPVELAMWAEYGVDFEKVFDCVETFQVIKWDYLERKITETEYDELFKAAEDNYNNTIGSCYEKVWKEHVEAPPPCYLYEVELWVKHRENEVIKECQLVAGDMSRTIQIGEITQLYEPSPHAAYSSEVVGTGAEWIINADVGQKIPNISEIHESFSNDYLTGDAHYPWPQSGYLADVIYFTAKNDITLKDVQSLDGYYDIKAAELAIIGQNGQVIVSWTPGTELLIRKGETVVLRVYFDHPDFHGMECSVRDELRLFYNDANGGGYIRQVYSFLRRRPLMEMYLWAFKGIDTKAFAERWREHQRFMDDHRLGINPGEVSS